MIRTIVIAGTTLALALAVVSGYALSPDQETPAASAETSWTLPAQSEKPGGLLLAQRATCGKWPKCDDEACVGGVEHDCRKDNGTKSCTPVPRDKGAKKCKVAS